jgi:Ankyrin repeats (3 copies)
MGTSLAQILFVSVGSSFRFRVSQSRFEGRTGNTQNLYKKTFFWLKKIIKMNSSLNLSRRYLLEKSQSCSDESSFAYSPASSTMSSSSSTCSSPPPASPMSTLSDPPSPASWNSDCDEQQTVTSSASKKRTSNHFDDDVKHFQPYVNKKPKFATKYDEMLQPLSPMTYLPVESLMLPTKTHQANFNLASQKQFRSLLESKAATSEIESFLCQHSETIDINEYNSEGRTALHQCCFEGNLPTAKVLVRFGANAKLTTRDGFSLLHLAAFSGHSNFMFYIFSLKQ